VENLPKKINERLFEDIKNVDEDGLEYWLARDIAVVLEYSKWENFKNVIEKAKTACEGSKIEALDHFADVRKTIQMPKTATKEIEDIMLTRYACYLIVQNGDPKKEPVALGQTYFAIKTREMEIQEDISKLTDDEKRIMLRKEMTQHNKSLAEAAKQAGVINYGKFTNYGYKGLYGGLDMREIQAKKGLSVKQPILDFMGSTELAANLFRATQTDEKIRRENIKGEDNANNVHYQVGKKVRQTMKEISGVMPEDLPVLEDVRKVEKKGKKMVK